MRPSPLQNRVDPTGALHAVAARGALMGNRGGRFHKDNFTLGARRYVSRRWIICVCEFRGRARNVWGAGYTELFFLDEATALAAGHRPCFECRRDDAAFFAQCFGAGGRAGADDMTCARAEDLDRASADVMDRALDDERRSGRTKRLHFLPIDDLPDGAMVVRDGLLCAVRGNSLAAWSFAGYGPPQPRPRGGMADTLTPPSTLRALARGYRPRGLDAQFKTG